MTEPIPSLLELRETDRLLDEVAGRRTPASTGAGDPVLAALTALATEVDEAPVPGLSGTRIDRVRAARRVPRVRHLGAVLAVGLTLSSTGIAAAVTGDPLLPIKVVAHHLDDIGHQPDPQSNWILGVPHRDIAGTEGELPARPDDASALSEPGQASADRLQDTPQGRSRDTVSVAQPPVETPGSHLTVLDVPPAGVPVAPGSTDRSDSTAGTDQAGTSQTALTPPTTPAGPATPTTPTTQPADPDVPPVLVPVDAPADDPSDDPSDDHSDDPSGDPGDDPGSCPSDGPTPSPTDEPPCTSTPDPGDDPSVPDVPIIPDNPSPGPGTDPAPDPTPDPTTGSTPDPAPDGGSADSSGSDGQAGGATP